MRRIAIGFVVVAAALAAAAAGGVVGAGAQDDFQPDRVRLLAIFRTLDLGEKAFLSGQFRHLDNPDADTEPIPDKRLVLEESLYPFTTWTPVAETVTDQEGYYFFTRQPDASRRYRVRSDSPAVVSKEPIVRVRAAVSLRANRSRVREGSSVLFSGTVTPPHDARTVLLQKLGGDGKFRTVKRIRLRGAPPLPSSTFRVRLRFRRAGVQRYRAYFPAGDGDHLPGATDPVEVTVVEKPKRRKGRDEDER